MGVASVGDLTVPVEAGRRVAENVPDATLEILPGNNHCMLALADDSEQIIARADEFIRSHPEKLTN